MSKTTARKPAKPKAVAEKSAAPPPVPVATARDRLAKVSVTYKAEDHGESDEVHTLWETLRQGFYRHGFTDISKWASLLLDAVAKDFGPRISPDGEERQGVYVGRLYHRASLPDHAVEVLGFVRHAGGVYGVLYRDQDDTETWVCDLLEFVQTFRNYPAGTEIVEVLPEVRPLDYTQHAGPQFQCILVHKASALVGKSNPDPGKALDAHHTEALLDLRRQLRDWTPPPSTVAVVNAAMQSIERPEGMTNTRWEYAKAGVRLLAARINEEVARRNA